MNKIRKVLFGTALVLTSALTVYASEDGTKKDTQKSTLAIISGGIAWTLASVENTAGAGFSFVAKHPIISSIASATLIYLFRKPIFNFFKVHIAGWLFGDTISQINDRTESIDQRAKAIEQALGPLRESAQQLHAQIDALPEQNHQALVAQEAALRARIEELEHIAQDATQQAFEQAQGEIRAVGSDLSVLRGTIDQEIAANTRHRALMEERAHSLQQALESGALEVRELNQRFALFEKSLARMNRGIQSPFTITPLGMLPGADLARGFFGNFHHVDSRSPVDFAHKDSAGPADGK